MPHNWLEKEQEIQNRFEFVVFADTEVSVFNAALVAAEAIATAGD